jgi:hypothetical protein
MLLDIRPQWSNSVVNQAQLFLVGKHVVNRLSAFLEDL